MYNYAQNNRIEMDAFLNVEKHRLEIEQEIIYFNKSSISLDTIYLLNWPHSYKGRNTPLTQRMIEDYDKNLYFSKKNERGYTKIDTIFTSSKKSKWKINVKKPDVITLVLNSPIEPNDSIKISLKYKVKIPLDQFTKYGRKGNTYNLRNWHITPAVYNKKWHTMSNLNLDDYYMDVTDYYINLKVFEGLIVNTDLNLNSKITTPPYSQYDLSGINRVDLELNISTTNSFKNYKSSNLSVITNVNGTTLQENLKSNVVNRQLSFIKNKLGTYPHGKLVVNKITYEKNPIYGLNQLPKFLNPFTGIFEWDIKMFKALTRKFLENTIIVNRRTDSWLLDGIQTYLIMQYVEKYYPEVKAMGNISKIWGVRSYNIAKLDFNDKYPFVYQFAARKNLDQSLVTSADSLSNFNRKIVNKYKAGIGLQYLNEYLRDSTVTESIKEFYLKEKLKRTTSSSFKKYVTSKTDKNTDWFFGDYVKTKKKIDYTISKVKKSTDSIEVTIKNKRNFTAPIALYGINKQKKTIFKKWLENIDTTLTIKVPKGDYKRLVLNYDYQYPELNLRDNWKNLKGIFNKPIQLRFFKDIENPFYNQVFYNVTGGYNFYDGFILGTRFYNEALFKKKWLYRITPSLGFKSKRLSGSASLVYEYLPEDSKIYRYRVGISGSTFQYAPDLSYTRFTPFLSLDFNRNTLRDIGGKSIFARYILVDRETEEGAPPSELDSYNVFNLRYSFADIDIIKDLSYSTDFQLSKNFSKLALDLRYRRLTEANRRYDLRLFAGTFIYNNTNTSEFSFSLDRPTDYLFDYNYLGRSEQAGFLSQQIIIAEGGFKSRFNNSFANQWMVTSNASIGIWRWIEAYADGGVYKNKGFEPQFRYDTGIRLNFVHNILEVYFPLQSSLGFEPNLPNYGNRIRFVLTLSPGRIFNFIKRGFY